ncbi:MAG: serine/threonine protein kinase [Calditrichaeota bacterium]|nr:serine/threonine protein kinase [Calditrichota bacterium]MCB9366749.1 serine/threonine protein kinase [Calditrichota bacterium]
MPEIRLELIRELSRSGVATVWEGRDNSLDRKVLVKSIHPQYARDADLRIRFEREARAIARISHPNVVQIYDIQSGEDSLSLLLEFVEGETLGSLLKRRGALPYSIALRVMTDVLAGLEQAHSQGIVHRDLKPDNILLSKSGVVKITDFGLASLRDLPGVTMEGAVVGTPSYMAPEQALGGETGVHTDLFTCGAMFFEMLTGKRLISGDSLGEAFQSVMKYRPPDLTAFAKSLPPDIVKLLESLLERDPSDRPESAAIVRKQIISGSTELPAAPDALTGFMEGTDWTRPANEILLKAGRHSRYWAYVGAALLVIALAGIWAVTLREKPRVAQLPKSTPADTIERTIPENIPETAESTIVRDTVPVVPAPAETTAIRRDSVPRTPISPPASAPSGPAYATLSSTPWARVFYNDSLLGTTPLATPLALAAGEGTLLFLNDEIGFPVTQRVNLAAGDTAQISVNLHEFLGRLRIVSVRPWADVYVDGEMKFRTPSAKVLYLPLGRHSIELRHPSFPTYHKEVVFEPHADIFEVRADLTQQ